MRILLRAGNSPFHAPPPREGPGFGNSGNVLFAHSVFKALYTQHNVIEVDEYDPDFRTPDEINERYDAFVLPMANAFRPQFLPQLERYTALIRRLKIPCIVVGVGVQASLDLRELKGDPIDSAVRAFAASVLERSAEIGVRGEYTHAYLNDLGFRAVNVIGCPSMFFHGAEFSIANAAGPPSADAAIAVNHSPAAGAHSAEFIRQLLNSYPNSTFVAQENANEETWRGMISDEDPKSSSRVRHFGDISTWLGFMRRQSFSIGTRIHGNIAAMLAGIPAVVLVHDARIQEIVRYHRIPHALAESVTAETRLETLVAGMDVGAANAFARAGFDHYRRFLEKNGLVHAYGDPQNVSDFNRRLEMASLECSGADPHPRTPR